jgi:glycosyltransferase involved in cell wall biosynthesis
LPRLLVCTDTYPPQVNGVSVVTSLSVEGLIRRGWDCAVVAPRFPKHLDAGVFAAAPTSDGPVIGEVLTTIPSVPLYFYPDIRLCLPSPWRVRRAVVEFKPDLIHCATEFILGYLGQREALRLGVPTVTSYHTEFAQYARAYGFGWLYGPVTRHVTRFHRRARRTYTPGGPARDALLANGVRDVELWGRGVDVERFHPARRDEALRAKLGVSNRFAFLLVTRLAAEKGVKVVLDAYREAASRLPPDSTRLLIAGAGPERASLEAYAPPGAVFLGFVERTAALPTLYASCDLFCYASTTETLGLVVLEAMSAGLPVVAAPAGGVADHLRDGVNGLAYQPHDAAAMASAMVALATDATRRASLATAARKTAESLTWESELDRLDASYREVLLGRREDEKTRRRDVPM